MDMGGRYFLWRPRDTQRSRGGFIEYMSASHNIYAALLSNSCRHPKGTRACRAITENRGIGSQIGSQAQEEGTYW